MLETLFRSRIAVRVLGHFLTEPEREVYLRQLSRELDEPISAVRRELDRLEEFSLLQSRAVGNHKYFRVRQDFPVLRELQQLYLKTEGAEEQLRRACGTLEGVQLAFAYGAFASKGPAASEIDIIVVGPVDPGRLADVVASLERQLSRTVRCTHYETEEFRHLLATNEPTLSRILSGDKVVLAAHVGEEV